MRPSPKQTEPLRVVFAAPADAGVAEGVAALEGVEVEQCEALEGAALLKAACRAHILVPRSFQRIDRDLLVVGAGHRLRWIVQASAGLDNIDHQAATEVGVEVLPVDPGNAVSVAELVLASLLTLFRNLPGHWEATPAGGWPVRDRLPDRQILGKRLGLIGLGRTGSQVAQRALAFGMSVCAVDPYITSERFDRFAVERIESLEQMLPRIDALSVHCPLTDQTRGMLGGNQLRAMPGGSFLVNAARGGIIDEAALGQTLDDRHIAAAALDVFSTEPPEPGGIVSHPRVLTTPHLGGHTVESHLARGINLEAALAALIERLLS